MIAYSVYFQEFHVKNDYFELHLITNDSRQTDEQVTNLDSVVVNLFSAELTESEKSLLSEDLNFCPRPNSYNKGKLVEDTKAFTMRMRLKSHFADRGDSHSQEKYPNVITKSDWRPPKQGRDLEAFCESCRISS